MIIFIYRLSLDKITSYFVNDKEYKQTGKPNVILILMDTTRADFLSCYGYHEKTTPRIDELANNSVLYQNAYSTASWTLPSIASILTGTYPGYHGAHIRETAEGKYRLNKLSEQNITLAEILSQNGYQTAGFSSSVAVTKNLGLGQGFQCFDDRIHKYNNVIFTFGIFRFANLFFSLKDFLFLNGYHGFRDAKKVNQLVISWLGNQRKEGSFFLFIHYFDPHSPYFPVYSGSTKRKIPKSLQTYRSRHPNYSEWEGVLFHSVLYGNKTLLPEEREYLTTNYSGEISYLDEKIGEILDNLKSLGLYDNSLIVITADHGESFGEHNLMLHGRALYEDNIHVPLVIKYPEKDVQKGIINYPVSLSGLAPTILSYLSIAPPESIQGSPFQERESQKIVAQKFYSPARSFLGIEKCFGGDLISILFEDHKYIKSSEGEDQLFNIRNDPGEKENIIEKEKVTGEKTKSLLGKYIRELHLFKKKDNASLADKEAIENLKALGYITDG